ncbi:hypothetical protein HC028_18505 [Planosporangium flavigriseum]|uniref:Uncharacterized protein n=1 Tax=Planosporangium flavigriseum TaxID=373681 RepID=A0A8J3LQW9_9ACTN|nr:hypothetical protein [Planosporangium flavigriseum]NJC66480.1 hypothetical protein [Planosporangium flavigriseum]GIG76357.1 hypothetical protein Pfl04_47610 [Planosporangium flavigriseum]
MPTLTPDDVARFARLLAETVLEHHGQWTTSTPGIVGLAAARLPGHTASTGFGSATRAIRAAEPLLADYGISVRANRPHGQPRRWTFALTHMPTLDLAAA